MSVKEKVKIASFDFTGCEGCQLAKINLETKIVPLVTEFVEYVNFREAMDPLGDDYKIAFIEGSISTPNCVRRIRKIRKQADILVTMGSCAVYGGLQAMRNNRDLGEVRRETYPGFENMPHLESLPWSLPVSYVVEVNYSIPGCPLDKNEFVKVVQALLMDKVPQFPDYPVCVECKLKENECVYENGFTCMGPVTIAGCGACCPSASSPCIACRGLLPDPATQAQKDVLAKAGLTPETITNKFTWFNSYLELGQNKKEIKKVLASISED